MKFSHTISLSQISYCFLLIVGNEEKEDGHEVIEWYKSVRRTALLLCTLHSCTEVHLLGA